jgi:hypothetical protein
MLVEKNKQLMEAAEHSSYQDEVLSHPSMWYTLRLPCFLGSAHLAAFHDQSSHQVEILKTRNHELHEYAHPAATHTEFLPCTCLCDTPTDLIDSIHHHTAHRTMKEMEVKRDLFKQKYRSLEEARDKLLDYVKELEEEQRNNRLEIKVRVWPLASSLYIQNRRESRSSAALSVFVS